MPINYMLSAVFFLLINGTLCNLFEVVVTPSFNGNLQVCVESGSSWGTNCEIGFSQVNITAGQLTTISFTLKTIVPDSLQLILTPITSRGKILADYIHNDRVVCNGEFGSMQLKWEWDSVHTITVGQRFECESLFSKIVDNRVWIILLIIVSAICIAISLKYKRLKDLFETYAFPSSYVKNEEDNGFDNESGFLDNKKITTISQIVSNKSKGTENRSFVSDSDLGNQYTISPNRHITINETYEELTFTSYSSSGKFPLTSTPKTSQFGNQSTYSTLC